MLLPALFTRQEEIISLGKKIVPEPKKVVDPITAFETGDHVVAPVRRLDVGFFYCPYIPAFLKSPTVPSILIGEPEQLLALDTEQKPTWIPAKNILTFSRLNEEQYKEGICSDSLL